MKKLINIFIVASLLSIGTAKALALTDYTVRAGAITNNLTISENNVNVIATLKKVKKDVGNIYLGVETNVYKFNSNIVFAGLGYMRLASIEGERPSAADVTTTTDEPQGFKVRSNGYTGYIGLKRYLLQSTDDSGLYASIAGGIYLGNFKANSYLLSTKKTVNNDYIKLTKVMPIFKLGLGYSLHHVSVEMNIINSFKAEGSINTTDLLSPDKKYIFSSTPVYFSIGYTW